MDGFIGFVATAIMFYYSVVAGWCLYYLLTSVAPLPSNLTKAALIWEGFQGSYWPVVFHAMMMGAGGYIIVKGVASIERINKRITVLSVPFRPESEITAFP